MDVRQLFVNFALYADDDLTFKNELIGHMIKDLNDLKQSLDLSIQSSEISHFRTACHKVNSTITMLADEEFKNVIEGIKASKESPELVTKFNNIHSQLVQSLQAARQS